ncbi:macro domain-containing protein [[Eubacterium] hominis]|uniref:type II toxin-antitoxin system antitoxin DNA ADP-ribosyl glycohydrolase DarG n=1 Tax=[Eubacterium] hominis TaxID=2764325 RepID=UPI003A4E292C
MIKMKIGNIFESQMDVLVNTVNCVGVMGKGIAKTFKTNYPKMFDEYKSLCDKKLVTTGKLYPYLENEKVKVINFPTKQHWRSPSKLEYVISGLDWFVGNYKDLGIESIAFPPLGCGNGGLDWDVVGPIMYQKLYDLPIDIEVYAPFGIEKDKLSTKFLMQKSENKNTVGVIYDKINDNWLLILRLVKCLEESEYSVKVGRTIFQKICYVLTRFGTDTGLNFVKGTYGPYSSDIKNMITVLSNNNLIYEKEFGKMMLICVSDSFKINPAIYSEKDKMYVNKTYDLFKRIKDTNHAELITTILFSFDQLATENTVVTENLLFDYIIDWKKKISYKRI